MRLISIKVNANKQAQANALAAQLSGRSDDENSFNADNAYNNTGNISDPVVAYITTFWSREPKAQEIEQAITNINGITLHSSYTEARGTLKAMVVE